MVAIIAAGLAAVGCGSADSVARSTSRASSSTYLREDGDTDIDKEDHGGHGTVKDDSDFLAAYGKQASQADLQAITTVVKRYYTAAAANDGATACGLIDTSLAVALTEGAKASHQGDGNSCTTAVSHIFTEQHAQLEADEVATMVVIGAHTKGDIGVAVVGFRKVPQGEILLERERGAWKLAALFNSELP